MAGLPVPSTADVMGKTIRLQSSKKTSTCSEGTLIFLGVIVSLFFFGLFYFLVEGFFLLLSIKSRKLTEPRTYSVCLS